MGEPSYIGFFPATVEKVIGEISYSEHSDEPRNEMTLEEIPPNVTSMQPIETSSVASELPEFSHTLDTTLTISSSGSSPPPPQRSTTDDTSNKDSETLSASISAGNGDTSQNKHNRLRSCIIRLTELSNTEHE